MRRILEMGNKSLSGNFLYNSIYQFMTLVTPLITTPYVSRVLSVDGVGTYSYASSIVTYFTLACVMGTTSYGQRAIGGCQNDSEKRSRVFCEIIILRFLTSMISFCVFLFYCIFISDDMVLSLITSMNIIGIMVDINWFFQGMEEFKKVTIRNLLFKAINIVGLFVFIKKPDDIYKYAFLMCGCSLAGNLFMWKDIRKYLIRVGDIKPFRNLNDILLLFIPTIATQVYTVLDKTMIGLITNSTYENGCYEQAEKIVRMSLSVVTALSGVLFPRISFYYENNKKKEVEIYLYKAFRLTFFLVIPIAIGIATISDLFVPVFFGAGYDDVSNLMKIFSPLVIFVGTAQIVGLSYLIPTKQQNIYTIAVSISAVVNIIFNSLLIPRIGSYGAAIASVTAEAFGVTIELCYTFMTHQLQIGDVFKGAWKYVLSAILMGLLVRIQCSFVSGNVFWLIINICCGVVSYILILVFLKDDFLCMAIISMIKKKMKKH